MRISEINSTAFKDNPDRSHKLSKTSGKLIQHPCVVTDRAQLAVVECESWCTGRGCGAGCV